MTLAYKIAQMRDLQRMKAEAEGDAKGPEKPLVETSSDAPKAAPAIGAPKVALLIPGEPAIQRKVEPRPERLKHLSTGEIQCMFQDGQLLPDEVKWFQTRNIPTSLIQDRFSWMRF